MTSKIKTTFRMLSLIKNPITYFLDYLKLLKKSYTIYYLKNKIKYKVRSNTTDRVIINEIWLHKNYNPKGFKIKETDTVLDVGTHIGVFSIYASKFAKQGKVYSFEPMPENFELLKQNIQLNKADNIIPINKALSNKSGKTDFYISKDNNKGDNSLFQKNQNTNKITVETLSFSEFIKKNNIKQIDFLKMDCEGGEYDILFKSSKIDIKKIKKISMEYHNISKEYNGKILKHFLENLGFKVYTKPESKKGMLYAVQNN